ncbi:hypothetical protein AtDm6_0391 [Acetobacter tropicalis]|uniref:Uncharacterized protein n=1 Tax=Acetobacter tropicalis TaxID=104102 RepID=A0A094YXH4_9PROT|nr:hypothetical protein AtDm6_0391 [Acetobacter tropicalis]
MWSRTGLERITILSMMLRQTEPGAAASHTQPAKAEISN